MEITPTKRRFAGWAAAAVAAVVLVVVGYMFVVGPAVDRVFLHVTDDRCGVLASGKPDRDDPDCYNAWGADRVDEWLRAHPAP